MGDDDIEAVEAEIDYDCEVPGVFPDPDYCMRYIRCNKELFVRRPNSIYCEITRSCVRLVWSTAPPALSSTSTLRNVKKTIVKENVLLNS